MKFKFKLIIISIAMMLISNCAVIAAPFKADAETKRIPAGTHFRLQLMDNITSVGAEEGDYFSAMLMDDQKNKDSVILPAGSIIRGNLRKVLKARRLSRGAVIYLYFDHVVTPDGKQLPLELSICNRNDLTVDGGIYGSRGYGEAVKNSWDKAVDITRNATDFGSDLGDDSFSGAKYITIPICAAGGAIGGGGYFVGEDVASLFKKGKDVLLNQGTVFDVILTAPVDVPVE